MSVEAGRHKRQQTSSNKIMFRVCLTVILILVLVVIFLLVDRRNEKDSEKVQKRDVVVNEENAEEVAEELIEKEDVRSGSYRAIMNSTWNFKDGTSVSENAYVENSETNTNDVYFDVQLADTAETIYESPLIPLGGYLDEIKLNKDLESGSYDCVLIYHLVDEEQETLSTLRMAITIIVEN